MAAFRSLLGFVPSIGFVQYTNTIQMVDAPVRVERDGVVVPVESGLVDARGVHLSLKIEGLPTQNNKFLNGPLSSEKKNNLTYNCHLDNAFNYLAANLAGRRKP